MGVEAIGRNPLDFRSTVSMANTAAKTIPVHETLTAYQNTGAVTVTLPEISEAAGRIYTIIKTNTGIDALTVADDGGAADWTNFTLNAQYDMVSLMSTGYVWVVLEDRSA